MEVFGQILSQLKATFAGLSRGKQITLICLLVGTIAGFFFLMTWSAKSEYQALYSGLTPEDAGVIVARLKEQKVPYRIAANGATIMIPEQNIYETRMQMASEGLPQGGSIGFEVFDNTKLGMTEFAQNVNYQRALQGELARSIAKISEIESCRVHLVMPEKSLFLQNEQSARASVVLKLRAGKWLNQGQINGIVHLVSSSVPRLAPENVTVIDGSGKLLAGMQDKDSAGSISSDQLQYQQQVEKNLENRIKTMLDSALGQDKSIVRVSCQFDFKKQEKTEERYLPDNQVVRSEQLTDESSMHPELTPQGVPGIRSNLPGDSTASQQNTSVYGNASSVKKDRTVNYEIGKIVSRTTEPVGTMTRLSVAVLVDGVYKQVKKNGIAEWQYSPRSTEEMKKLENLVKRAVNFSTDRGDQVEVVNIPFETTKLPTDTQVSTPGGWREFMSTYKPYMKYGFLSLFLMLSFLFFVRPLVRWLTEYSFGDMQMFKQLPKTVGELEGELNSAGRLTFKDRASELIIQDSETSRNVVREWIKEN